MKDPLFLPGGTQMSETPTPQPFLPSASQPMDPLSQLPPGGQAVQDTQDSQEGSQSAGPSQAVSERTRTQVLGKRRLSDDNLESQTQGQTKGLNNGSGEGSLAGEDRSIVGVLLGDVEGIGQARVAIRMNKIILIGRSPACDVTLNYPAVSRIHLRLTPVRTGTSLTTVSLSDMSSYGFYLNDVFHRPDRLAKIDNHHLRCKTYILNENDTIRLPGCPTVFTYHQGPSHRNALNTDAPVDLFTDVEQPRHLLGNYWVVHNFHLGDGSFGVVNLASHRTAAWFQVACKTVKAEKKEERLRHLSEVRVLQRTNHPNVNGILDLIREGDYWHMILELMAGGDLFAYHEKHGCLAEMEVRWIGWQLVQGLEHLHKMDIAHRDLKPENILLTASAMYPRVVIADFGHAIDYQALLEKTPKSDHETHKREVMHIGTASFMPPERLKLWLRPPGTMKGMFEDLPAVRGKNGKAPLTRRERLAYMWLDEEKAIDSWSLGVTLYLAATGCHPYETIDTTPAATQAQSFANRMPSGSQSWASFRQGSGNVSSLGSGRVSPAEFDKLKKLYEGCQLTPYLFESSKFNDFSDEAKQFLRVLLEPKAERRLTIASSSKHDWFKAHYRVLSALWDSVIMKGDILHPDTAEALIKSTVDEDDEDENNPPTQASQESPIETVHTHGRKRRRENSESIEDAGETPLTQFRDDIEVDDSLINASAAEDSFAF